MGTILEGGCLCGSIRYSAHTEPLMVGSCYCTDCRRSSGTSHGTHAVVPDAELTVKGELRFYDRPSDSGNMVSRGFCPQCGCAILSRNAAMPGVAFLRVSSLDDPDLVTPQMAVYASRAPAWAEIDRSKPVFDLMPEGGPQAALDQA